jgi:hypothetical protein
MGYLRAAIGVGRVTNTDQLIGYDLKIKVTVKPAQGDYDASNSVSGWAAIEGAQLPRPKETAKPSAGNVPDWAKPKVTDGELY